MALPLALAVTTLFFGGPADALPHVTAVAQVNEPPFPIVNDTNNAGFAHAFLDTIDTTVRRLRLDVNTDGFHPNVGYGSIAHNETHYVLWNMGTNTALDPAIAVLQRLNFNFRITGLEVDDGFGNHTMGMALSVNLTPISGANYANNFSTTCFGGCLIGGDSRLAGVVDFGFTVLHHDDDDGALQMEMQATATNNVGVDYHLFLESITFADAAASAARLGTLAADPLRIGVRFGDPDGNFLGEFVVVGVPVSSVSEPASLTLLVMGLVGLAAVRRRKS